MKPELIFTILILLIALLIGPFVKNCVSELLKVQKVERVEITL